MTKRKKTPPRVLINLLLDYSTSMQSCRAQTISGINEYVDTQKKLAEGEAFMNFFTFATDSTGFPSSYGSYTRGFYSPMAPFVADPVDRCVLREVFVGKAIADVETVTRETYDPRGNTPLLDAIGQNIRKIDEALSQIKRAKKKTPAVLFVIMTDGEENSSNQYNREDVRRLINERDGKGWSFIYLGANQDAWEVGKSYGMKYGNVRSYSTENMTKTMSVLGRSTSAYRASGASATADFFSNAPDLTKVDAPVAPTKSKKRTRGNH